MGAKIQVMQIFDVKTSNEALVIGHFGDFYIQEPGELDFLKISNNPFPNGDDNIFKERVAFAPNLSRFESRDGGCGIIQDGTKSTYYVFVQNHRAYSPTLKEPEPTNFGRWWQFENLEEAETFVLETNA